MPEPLVAVTRGDLIESVHRGHIVVTDESGSIIFCLGDPSFNLCLRSCAKPLQALPVIATGAEGGYALSLMEKGWGVAIKIEDGSNRALSPAVIETLSQLGMLSADEAMRLQPYHQTSIYNHRKEIVGEVRACFHLTG
jgi:L-asparaginase II